MKNSSRLLAEIDRKRTRSSSGWMLVGGLLQDAAVEVQPGQFAVDETLRLRTQATEAASGAGSSGRGGRDFLNLKQ